MRGIDKSKIKSVLIIKLRHIGDVLLTAPTIKALKRALPDARITAVVPAGMEDMLTLNPDLCEVIPLAKGSGILSDLAFINKLRDRGFDLAVNMTEGDRGAILALLCGARYRIGIDPINRGFFGKKHLFTHLVRPTPEIRHKVLTDMDVLGPIGITPALLPLELFVSQEDREYIGRLLLDSRVERGAPVAVVHPASRWLFKCWRDERVASVIDYLEDRGIKVVLTAAPDDKEIEKAKNILSLVKTSPLDLSGRLSLKRLAALLERGVLFFGVDTAPMHMAAAMGTPVVALFGPSDYRVWGPYTNKARVVVKAGEFPCLPCGKDGCDGTKKSKCLDAITVEEAVAAIEGLIGPG